HTRWPRDWSSDVCSSDLTARPATITERAPADELPSARDGLAQLTRRETDVLRLVALGLTNAAIAERLCISPCTVAQHLQSIYGKIGRASWRERGEVSEAC